MIIGFFVLLSIQDNGVGLNLPVQAAHGSFRRAAVRDIARQRITLPIRDATGRHLLYRLVCGSGLDDEHPEDLSGLIMCKLLSSDRLQNPRDLLALERPGSGRSWDTRGRFLESEVAGRCGDTRNWGRNRVFHIGSMLIQLRVHSVELGSTGRVESYSFTASIRNLTARDPPQEAGAQPNWFGSIDPCPI